MTFAAAILEIHHLLLLVGPAETRLLSLVAEPRRHDAPFLLTWLVILANRNKELRHTLQELTFSTELSL